MRWQAQLVQRTLTVPGGKEGRRAERADKQAVTEAGEGRALVQPARPELALEHAATTRKGGAPTRQSGTTEHRATPAPPSPKLELDAVPAPDRGSASAKAQGADSDSDAGSADSMESVKLETDTDGEQQPRSARMSKGLRVAAAAVAAEAVLQAQPARGSASGAGTLRVRAAMRNLLELAGQPVTLAIGDRRGKVRDAVTAQGRSEVAVSVDEAASESKVEGLHVRLDAKLLGDLPPVARLFSFMPCEQQAVSLGPGLAAVKALDGRMFWGIVQWLHVWCIHADCAYAEQPDTYIVDFYDASHFVTCLSDWASDWKKREIIFVRNAPRPRPTTPGAKSSSAWHARRPGGAEAQAKARDETPDGMASAFAEQCRPLGQPVRLDAEVEVERFAAAWHLAGLPVPTGYNAAHGLPSDEEEQRYARARGQGDGRRVAGDVVPRLLQPRTQPEPQTAATKATEQRDKVHRRWHREPLEQRLEGVRVPPVTGRGMQLARTARRLREKEVVEAAEVSMECLDLSTLTQEAIVVLPARREGAQMMILLPAQAGSWVLGRTLAGAAGRTAAARKAGTAASRQLLRTVYNAEADVDTGTGVRAAPVSYVEWRGTEIAIVAAWVPSRQRAAEERAGLIWYSMSQMRCSLVAAVCKRVQWSRDGWAAPQRDVFSGDRRGAIKPAPTALNDVAAAPPLNNELAEARLQRDIAELQRELREAAAAEPHIAAQLAQWADKAAETTEAMTPPRSVRYGAAVAATALAAVRTKAHVAAGNARASTQGSTGGAHGQRRRIQQTAGRRHARAAPDSDELERRSALSVVAE